MTDRRCARQQWQSVLDYIDRTESRATNDPAYRDAINYRVRAMINAEMQR